MKRFITPKAATMTWSPNAILAATLVAAAILLAAPSPAQGDFPGATKINVICPTSEELRALAESGGTLPEWAKDIIWEPIKDPAHGTGYNGSGYNVSFTVLNYTRYLSIFKRNPFFSPDGNWIVFDDKLFCAWMVPVTGGEPKLIGRYDSTIKLERGSDGQLIFTGGLMGVARTYGLSPDGKEIISILNYADPSRGKTYEETNSQYSGVTVWMNMTRIVSRNIETKQERFIAEDAIQGRWSHAGSLFAYVKAYINEVPPGGYNWDDLYAWEQKITGLYVKDLSTGAEKLISPLAVCPCFTPDDAAVMCSMKDSSGLWQIFRIPLDGGSPKQITFYGPNDTGRNARVSDVSPDGKWILHTGDFNVGDMVKTGLCVCNLVSGVSYPLFPNVNITNTEASWSPDGKKFVFSAYDPAPIIDNVTGYSIYMADFNPDSFGKPSAVAEILPEGFSLTGNYPNPFNPSTSISFTLPASGQVSLAVYDITGRTVRELVSGSMPAGAHSVTWDGRDENGTVVSSGVYLSRLVQGKNSVSRRMLLVK